MNDDLLKIGKFAFMTVRFFLGVFFFSMFVSCETDFEINSNWKEIMVVHAVLDKSDDVQYVRINKAFLGSQDAFLMASVSDSSNYNPANLVVRIIEMKKLSSTSSIFESTDSIDLDYIVMPKNDGIFYTDENIIYKTRDEDSTFFKSEREYKIKIKNKKSGLIATSQTKLIDNINVTTSFPSFYRLGFYNGGEYTSTSINWSHSSNAYIYQVTLKVNYSIDSAGLNIGSKQFDWVLPIQNYNGNRELSQVINGQQFFSKLSLEVNNSITNGENPNYSRKVTGIDVQVSAATDDLNTYMLVNRPLSNISQQRPTFTNINNGIGIFTSKYNFYVSNLLLSEATHQALSNELSELNFRP